MGVVFVMGGRFLMMPRLDILMIVSMETWPRRRWMSRRILVLPNGEGINGEERIGGCTCHDLELEVVHKIGDR